MTIFAHSKPSCPAPCEGESCTLPQLTGSLRPQTRHAHSSPCEQPLAMPEVRAARPETLYCCHWALPAQHDFTTTNHSDMIDSFMMQDFCNSRVIGHEQFWGSGVC